MPALSTGDVVSCEWDGVADDASVIVRFRIARAVKLSGERQVHTIQFQWNNLPPDATVEPVVSLGKDVRVTANIGREPFALVFPDADAVVRGLETMVQQNGA